jgi:GT2 family glycosyltransferase
MYQKVSIIIINWNGWEDTIECLESLYQIKYPNYDVIVVDNNSDDDSLEKIREYCAGKISVKSDFFLYNAKNKPIELFEYSVKSNEMNNISFNGDNTLKGQKSLFLLKNIKNDGFAQGNNIGIKFSLNYLDTDYFFLLNNDTVVDPNFLNDLMNVAVNDSSVGILGPKVYYYSEKDKINIYGGKISFWTGRTSYPEFNTIDHGQNSHVSEIDYISGCSLLIKKDAIMDAGILNPQYFLYYEDTEWCFRVRKKGFKVLHVPKAKIWHKFSSTAVSATGIYYLTRNRFFFMRENAYNLQFFIFLLFFILYFLFHHIRILLYYRDINSLFSLYRGFWDGLITPSNDFVLK